MQIFLKTEQNSYVFVWKRTSMDGALNERDNTRAISTKQTYISKTDGDTDRIQRT